MRKRTEKEKEVMGRIVPILRSLDIKQTTRGYVPLLDIMSYAASYPEVEFEHIIKRLLNENNYIGINLINKNSENQIMPAMLRTVESAFERGNNEKLSKLGISDDIISRVLDSDKYNETDLVAVLGEKYENYTHEEKIVYYFIRKILKYLNY